VKNKFIRCGRLTYELLEYLHSLLEPGITTLSLDEAAVKWAEEHNCELGNYNYRGYPAHICVNINEEVQHSIPGYRRINDGDIVNIDLTIKYDGVLTDAARTWVVGKVDKKYEKMIHYTESAFKKACRILKPGVKNTELTKIIHGTLKEHGYYPVKGLTGHGIGEVMHQEPFIANNEKDVVPEAVLEIDKAYAIEPIVMYKEGKVVVLHDGWTIVSDNIMHAQYEDTLYLVEGGYINVTNGSIEEDKDESNI